MREEKKPIQEHRLKKKSRKTNRNNRYIMIVLVVVFLIVAAALATFCLRRQDETQAAENTGQDEKKSAEKWQEGTIKYNGKTYRYNTSINTYLFMGIDHEGPVEKAADGVSGGQSDAMFLLVTDAKHEIISVVGINRNTMTGVDVYDKEGNYVDTRELQICLQHGFGDGMRTSCLRTADAVSTLFYNLPINGYLSLNMGGIPMMNDSVGGVTVDVLEDVTYNDVSLKKGETKTLTGKEAYAYLRKRDVEQFNSAGGRMERQMQYLTGFMGQVRNAAKEDMSAVVDVYNAMSDYIVTNIDFAKLADETLDYEYDASRMYSVPGETVMGEKYEEYHIDDTAFYEMILDIFYIPVE